MKNYCDLQIQADPLIPARKPDPVFINKKAKPYQQADFTFPADQRIEIKERETIDKYLDLAKALKKPWNMKETVLPIVVGALDCSSKGWKWTEDESRPSIP